MEAELEEAAHLYKEQIAQLNETLLQESDNGEIEELRDQLLEALATTLAALEEIRSEYDTKLLTEGPRDDDARQAIDASAATVDNPLDGDEVRDIVRDRTTEGVPYNVTLPEGLLRTGESGLFGQDACRDEGKVSTPSAKDLINTRNNNSDGAGNGNGSVNRFSGPTTRRPRKMHGLNIYCNRPPDFLKLAEDEPSLRPYVANTSQDGRVRFPYTSWEATRALTAALLSRDFGVRWDLPRGFLVPPVANRLNYLLWISDLLHLTGLDPDSGSEIRGLDVGCGANMIYCLLGAATHGWRMTGLEIDKDALAWSTKLIDMNPDLSPLLQVIDGRDVKDTSDLGNLDASKPNTSSETCIQNDLSRKRKRLDDFGERESDTFPEDNSAKGAETSPQNNRLCPSHSSLGRSDLVLLPAFSQNDSKEGLTYSFTVCNPPFFTHTDEAGQNPKTSFGGSASEMACPGGELQFVRTMIDESRELKSRALWFSSMVGKKDSLRKLRAELHDSGVSALRTTELVQGRTTRWAIAWSWIVDSKTNAKPLRRHDGPTA